MTNSTKKNLLIVFWNLYSFIFVAPTGLGFFTLCNLIFPFDKNLIIASILLLIVSYGIFFSFSFPYWFVSIPLAICISGISTFGLYSFFEFAKITIENPWLTIILIIYFLIFSACTAFVHITMSDV